MVVYAQHLIPLGTILIECAGWPQLYTSLCHASGYMDPVGPYRRGLQGGGGLASNVCFVWAFFNVFSVYTYSVNLSSHLVLVFQTLGAGA